MVLKTLKGIIFGYVLRVVRSWSGDLLLADLQRFARIGSGRGFFCQKTQKSGSIRYTPIRVSLREWNPLTTLDCHRPFSEAEGNPSPDKVQFRDVRQGRFHRKRKVQNGHNPMPNCNQLAATVESMRLRPMTRINSS